MLKNDLIAHNIVYIKNNKEKINPNYSKILQSNIPLLEKIKEKTSFLDQFNPSIIERIFVIKNNIQNPPLCPICSAKIKFKHSYSLTCSLKCYKQYERQQIDPKTGNTLSQSRIDKVRNANNKIGEDGLTGYQRAAKKIFSKMTKKEHEDRVKKIINTKKSTFLEDGTSIWDAAYEKQRKTFTAIKENGLSSAKIAAIKRENKLKSIDPITGKTFKELAILKSIENRKRNFFKSLKIFSTQYELISTEDEYINTSLTKWKCSFCGNEFEHSFYNGTSPRCIICHPKNENLLQKSLVEFIKSVYSGEILENNRTTISPYEVDIYLPDLNIGIELNGNYWHSEKFREPTYHLDKSTYAYEKGINLIHISDDEWLYKRNIIESIILNKLKLIDIKFYARKLNLIFDYDKKNKIKEFLNQNHLQGYIPYMFCSVLLDDNDEILSAMTFNKSRFNKKYDYEISRFCVKNKITVSGAASRLFNEFLKNINPKSVISYADRRITFNNHFYTSLGFTFSHNTPPNYRWVKNNISLSRYQTQRKLLTKYFNENFDKNLTEDEIMISKGFIKSFDCGSSVYVFSNIK
jgi:hypothetical protein